MSNPISPKVIAAAIGAGAGATVSTLILWIIGVTAFHIPVGADYVNDAVAAVPSPIAAAIALLLVIAGAAFPGYQVTDPMRIPELVAAAEAVPVEDDGRL